MPCSSSLPARSRWPSLGYIAASGLLAAAVAIAAYGLALPAGYLAAVGQVTALRPAELSAESWPQSPEGSDPAVLQYFYGPAMADARHAMTVAYQRSREWWGDGAGWVSSALHSDLLPVTVPAGIGGAVGMVAGASGRRPPPRGGLRCRLSAHRRRGHGRRPGHRGRAAQHRLRAAQAEEHGRIHCPNCGERAPYPGYVCPGARGALHRHRDVRPGRFGIVPPRY